QVPGLPDGAADRGRQRGGVSRCPRLPRQAPDPAGPLVHEGQRVLRGRGAALRLARRAAHRGEGRTALTGVTPPTDRLKARQGFPCRAFSCARSTPGARREGRAVVWAVAGDGRAATRGRTLGLPWAGRGRPLGGPHQRPPDRRTALTRPGSRFPTRPAFPEVFGQGEGGIRPLCPTETLAHLLARERPPPSGAGAFAVWRCSRLLLTLQLRPALRSCRGDGPASRVRRCGPAHRGCCWPATPPRSAASSPSRCRLPVPGRCRRRSAGRPCRSSRRTTGRPRCSC